eukprot:2029017-Pleurochrysis_carterae.AAC.1
MRRWDFVVAAYLQGELQEGEIVYCHAPPGYAAVGADGRPRICRVEKPIYGIWLRLAEDGNAPCSRGC